MPRIRVGTGFLVISGIALGNLVGSIKAAAPVRERPPPTRQAHHRAPVAPPRRAASLPLKRLTISAVGDLTFGRSGVYPSGGATSLLRAVRPYLGGAVTIGNLETVLGAVRGDKCGTAASAACFAFEAPASYATELRRSGFDLLNVANNHADDYGSAGRASTLVALRAAGLAHTGKPAEITVLRRRGIRVGVVGFAPYPWAASLLDVPRAARLVRRAARRVDIVVVTMHAGAEGLAYRHVRPGAESYLGEQRGDVVRFAHAVVDAGADLVVGHGPHVLRGLEWYRGRLVAYSLGNFTGFRTLSTAGDLGVSAVLHATLDERGKFVRGWLTPVRLDATGTPHVDTSNTAWRVLRALSLRDFGARAAAPSSRGAIDRPDAGRAR